MNTTYTTENAAERKRLFTLTDRLTDQELARPLPNGWTVATKLAHLAFWDLHYVSLVQEWKQNGFAPVPAAVDPINEAVRAVSSRLPPREVVQLVRNAAETVDREIDALPAELATAIEQGGYRRVLYRAMHRRVHLDQIEDALRG